MDGMYSPHERERSESTDEILQKILNSDSMELLLESMDTVLQADRAYLAELMEKYNIRLYNYFSSDANDPERIKKWLTLLNHAAPLKLLYEKKDQQSTPTWLHLWGEMKRLLENPSIENKIKTDYILPLCEKWLAAYEVSHEFAHGHLIKLFQFSTAIEQYLATQPQVAFPYAHYVKLLNSTISAEMNFSGSEKQAFSRLPIERFLRGHNNPSWENFAQYLSNYKELPQFISYRYHTNYIDTCLSLLYQVPKMDSENDEVTEHKKAITKRLLMILERSRSLPELVPLDDKQVVIASVLSSAKAFIQEGEGDKALEITYYQDTSWSTRLTFCGLGLLTTLVLLFYALVAAETITGHSFLFLKPYFFLLHGIAGLVLPAATLVGAFLVYHAYHEIFSPKQEAFAFMEDGDPLPSQQNTPISQSWLSCCFGDNGPSTDPNASP